MRRSSRSAKMSMSFSRSNELERSLRANKTVKSLRRSSPILLRKYVLSNFIAENERSHDAVCEHAGVKHHREGRTAVALTPSPRDAERRRPIRSMTDKLN